jgi:hypothetical protein
MAKDQEPADQMDAFSKQAMAQAHEALDTYFDFLNKTVSSFPSGGTDGLRPLYLLEPQGLHEGRNRLFSAARHSC